MSRRKVIFLRKIRQREVLDLTSHECLLPTKLLLSSPGRKKLFDNKEHKLLSEGKPSSRRMSLPMKEEKAERVRALFDPKKR